MELPTLDSPSVEAFMAKVSSTLNTTLPAPSRVLSFGSTLPELIPRMNSLVLSGVKRGMAGFPAPINPITGDLIIAVDTEYQPAILVRVLSRTAVPFHEVTSKFVFEEGHPEMTIEFWKEWHQKFWEKSLDHDGTLFGNGDGKKVLNMIFEVVWPVPKPMTVESEPVKALLELVERVTGLKVEVGQVKDVFEFREGNREQNKKANSLAVAGKKTARTIFPAPKEQRKVGDYSVGLGRFNEPYLLIRTTSVEEKNFESVKEDFALAEIQSSIREWTSSGIQSLKGRQDQDGVTLGHGTGKTVLCQKFEVVWPTLEEFP